MKRLLLIMLLLLTAIQGFSQSKGISYQAVILNPNPQEIPGQNAQGNILANSAVSIEFSIINSSGTEEYQEQHSTRTDRYGMINLLIGTGAPTGSNDFSDIFWNGTVKKLKVAIDFTGGSNFSPLSEQNLTYMPQPPTQETTIEITNNTAAIATEKTRALQAEQNNATGISTLQTEQATQNTAIALNTAKVGVTPAQASTIGNTTGINTGDQDISGIAINAGAIITLQGEQTTQNTAISLNTAKTGITAQQASDITVNNAKVGYTEALVSANVNVVANTAKTGITTLQATAITNNSGAITTLQGEQTTQNTAIALNTAKTGITAQQASEITANTLKTGITTLQATAITNNSGAITMLQGEQTTQNTAISLNTAKTGITSQQTSDITANNTKVGYTEALVSANVNVVANTAKVDVTNGTTAGDMQYWNGTAWVVVATTVNEGATLQMIGGVPTWTGGTPPPAVPAAPGIGIATAGNAAATVTFTAPASNGGSVITGYTVTSSPGGLTATGTASPITVTGLTNGIAYTFTVTATNAIGNSEPSATSNSVTPIYTVAIGDLIQGGIVFWLDGNGGGKVCALADAPTFLNWVNAVTYCNDYTNTDTGTDVYNNWYLPSKDELQLMYANLKRFGCSTNTPGGTDSGACATEKGNFRNDYYWSSTEIDGSNAWDQGFSSGNQDFFYKVGTDFVRAVRAF